jgi:hypothetical protein
VHCFWFVEEAEAVAVAEAGDRGFKNPARGSHWRNWSISDITLKITKDN